MEQAFREKVEAGFESRRPDLEWSDPGFRQREEEYKQRLQHELEIILALEQQEFFLIAVEVFSWAKARGLLIGPGSGSTTGSLVNFCLGLTQVNPLVHGLIFELFLRPDQKCPPFFSIDVAEKQRQKLARHIRDRYGKQWVAPLKGCRPESSCIQFDIQELYGLSRIQQCLMRIKDKKGLDLELNRVSVNNKKAYRLLARGDCEGVLDIEKNEHPCFEDDEIYEEKKNILCRFQPDRISDLTAFVAHFRPVWFDSGLLDRFIRRRRAEEKVLFAVPELAGILGETYGLLLYREQIIRAATELAGFSVGRAEDFRRALVKNLRRKLAKKMLETMRGWHSEFMDGAMARGLSGDSAERVFQELFYGARSAFIKAHAASYAYLTYWAAYLKANFPREFSP